MLPLKEFGTDEQWQGTIEKVIPAIVCLEYMKLKSFDAFKAGSAKATGFVVDCNLGIILTNRFKKSLFFYFSKLILRK